MTAAELKAHRARLGYTQSQLAALLGLHLRSIAQMETNVQSIGVEIDIIMELLARRPELLPLVQEISARRQGVASEVLLPERKPRGRKKIKAKN